MTNHQTDATPATNARDVIEAAHMHLLAAKMLLGGLVTAGADADNGVPQRHLIGAYTDTVAASIALASLLDAVDGFTSELDSAIARHPVGGAR
jgi:hypothetical protein